MGVNYGTCFLFYTPTVQISLRKTSPAVFQIHSFNFYFDGDCYFSLGLLPLLEFDSREFNENSGGFHFSSSHTRNCLSLRAAVCKYRELAVKWKFRNSSYSVRKNPLVKRFRKSQSKFLKSFLFRENRQKVKCCPTPYSRRSKTFELYHFQSPREERRFKETSSSLAGK